MQRHVETICILVSTSGHNLTLFCTWSSSNVPDISNDYFSVGTRQCKRNSNVVMSSNASNGKGVGFTASTHIAETSSNSCLEMFWGCCFFDKSGWGFLRFYNHLWKLKQIFLNQKQAIDTNHIFLLKRWYHLRLCPIWNRFHVRRQNLSVNKTKLITQWKNTKQELDIHWDFITAVVQTVFRKKVKTVLEKNLRRLHELFLLTHKWNHTEVCYSCSCNIQIDNYESQKESLPH